MHESLSGSNLQFKYQHEVFTMHFPMKYFKLLVVADILASRPSVAMNARSDASQYTPVTGGRPGAGTPRDSVTAPRPGCRARKRERVTRPQAPCWRPGTPATRRRRSKAGQMRSLSNLNPDELKAARDAA